MKLLKSETAAATIVGQVIILAISIIGISTVMLYGVPAIYSLENLANVKNVEQSLTVLDSRASRAILGESPLQVNNINLGGGTLVVEPNSTSTKSYIAVKSSSFNFTIPMGRIRYTLGDRIVAYEGGGVWSKYPSGGSVMLSPPEFHYNGVTLSLPAINISGSTSVSGKGTATISFKKNAPQVLYPNTSLPNRTNPVTVSIGKVYVNITSDFYDAWAEYAKGLGYATVSTNSTTHTASLELAVVPSNLGENTTIANPVVFRGLNISEDTPLDNFSFWLDPFGNKFDWDIRASSGKKRLIFHIKGDAKEAEDTVDLNVGYEDDGMGYDKPAETWEGKDMLIVQESGGQAYLAVDLLNTSLNLTYKKKNVGAEASCSPDKIKDGKFNDTTGFSWNLTQTTQQNMQYNKKWTFLANNESWKSSNTTTTGTVTMSHNSTDGNSSGSLYSKLEGSSKTATTTWTSPNFTWNNGTPTSARLDFDWKVATFFPTSNPAGNYYVMLVKPDGSTSQINQTTTFNVTAGWSTKSNTTVSINDFSNPGNYSLKLIAVMNTKSAMGNPTVEVRWDNPTITLNYTGSSSSVSELTNKSLYDITQHYFEIMAIDGDGTITFYQCAPSGKQAPASDSTMLMDYVTPGGLTYLQISENRVDAGVS